MRKHSLIAAARHLLAHAGSASSGRSAETVYGGHEHALRHTLIALMQGRSLADHNSEGEATIYVISGRVRLSTEDADWEAIAGDLVATPPSRHRLDALEDSVILLTVVKPEAREVDGQD